MAGYLCTADDCGLTEGATRAIMACIDSGALQGASVLAGGFYAEEAMRALAARPEAVVAVHLNLFEGKPCAPSGAVPDLVTDDGFFRLDLGTLWRELAFGGKRKRERLLEQTFIEFQAQINTVLWGTGRTSARLDGHLHIHAMPGLLPVMEELFKTISVGYTRVPREPRYFPGLGAARSITGALRREILAAWSGPLQKLALKYDVAIPAQFLGAYASGGITEENLKRGLEKLKRSGVPGILEIMFHPSLPSVGTVLDERAWYAQSAYGGSLDTPLRERETALLLSPTFANLIAATGFRPYRAEQNLL